MNQYQNAQMFGGIGGSMPYGFAPQANPNPPAYTQPLTEEELATLRNNRDQFTLGLTQEEVIRAICFHRDGQKRETLRENPTDGTVTCLLCGKTFLPSLDLDEDVVTRAVNDLLDVLQTIKLLYLDMPVDAAREFFQIIALIEKIPKLYKIASENFVKHENWQGYRYNYGPSTQQLYSQLAGAGFGFAQPQQMPMGGFNQAPPQMYQQPSMMGGAAPMGGPAPMNNGFGYNAMPPMANGYMPAQQGFQYVAPANPTVVEQAAPAAEPVVNAQFEK